MAALICCFLLRKAKKDLLFGFGSVILLAFAVSIRHFKKD
jgi:hypothetical protein